MARPKPGARYSGSTVRSHRKPRNTGGGYKGRHRDTFLGRLAGRPTVAQILNNSRQKPGVFPGMGDVWGKPKAVGRVRMAGLFDSWP